MSKLYIPNSVALRSFDSIFTNNDFKFENNVNISFHPSYVAMHPIGMAFYAALKDLWREKKIDSDAEINYEIRSIPYLQRMGLFNALGFSNPVPIVEHEETGRFIPLTKIRNGSELESFIKTVDPILHITRNNSRAIKHVFSELLRNVIEHSDSEFGANVCATYNRKRKKISIGISDSGQGLLNSLKKNHDVSSDKDAIVKALTPGITGSTSRIGGNAQNAGAGLFFTKCIAQSTRNHFIIYSGSAYYKLLFNKKHKISLNFNPNPELDACNIKSNLPYFKGTLVGLDIHINDDKAFNNLIEKIGAAYQLGVKKTKKNFYKQIKFT